MRDNQVRSGTIRYTQVLSKTLYLYHDSTVFNGPKSPNSLVSPKSPNSPTTSPKADKNGLLSRKEAVENSSKAHSALENFAGISANIPEAKCGTVFVIRPA